MQWHMGLGSESPARVVGRATFLGSQKYCISSEFPVLKLASPHTGIYKSYEDTRALLHCLIRLALLFA